MKYIIEIENEPFGRNDDPVIPHGMDELYRAKGFKSLVFDKNGLDKLTPYTEPDHKAIEDEVWSMVKDIVLNMTPDDYRAYFGVNDAESIFKLCGCLETIDKYGAWKKQKYHIRVGDEVEYEDCKFVVTAEIGNKYHGIHSSNGNIVCFGEGDYCGKDKCKKTGRHFDEVAKLLEKMRGEAE